MTDDAEKSPPPPSAAERAARQRRERQARALRENLHKRKGQAAARTRPEDEWREDGRPKGEGQDEGE